jgi:hypothetical protein
MPMQIDEKHLTIAGFILTWLTGVFCGGIVYGRISAKVDKHDRALFTPDGDLRVVTNPAHDIMVEKCNKMRDLRITHVIASHEELKDDIAKLSETLSHEMKAMSEALHHLALNQVQGRGREDRP